MKSVQIPFIYLILLLTLVSCDGTAADSPDAMEGMEDMGEMEHEHAAETVSRIPNEGGAKISIVSPANNSTFSEGEQVIVEVSTENFPLGESSNHWHVYVDGSSWGMIMGGNSDYPLSGLEAGEHKISVFMSIETHEEYEDGDAITIIVQE